MMSDNDLCVTQGAVYGKCVTATTTGRQELKKDLCAKEFEALKSCFTNAVGGKTISHHCPAGLYNHSLISFFHYRPRKEPNKEGILDCCKETLSQTSTHNNTHLTLLVKCSFCYFSNVSAVPVTYVNKRLFIFTHINRR